MLAPNEMALVLRFRGRAWLRTIHTRLEQANVYDDPQSREYWQAVLDASAEQQAAEDA